MCITITVGERGRRVMGFSTTVINIILVFLSLTLIAMAVVIRVKLDEKLELLSGYNSGALPYFLIFITVIMFFVHITAAFFCYNASYVETRSDRHTLFVTLILVVIILFFLVVITEIVVIVHNNKLSDALYEGIYMSMKTYGTDLKNKMKIDYLQMEFECCGADSLRDWFEIPWVRAMYVNVESEQVKPYLKDGEFIKDDVPFSCCNKYSKRACVHHSVRNAAAHKNYEGHTLYSDGCVDAMMAYFKDSLITPTALLLLVVLILQVVDILVMRMLQTSIFEADEMDDPEGASMAYCIKGWGGGKDNLDYFARKKKDQDGDEKEEDEPEEDGEELEDEDEEDDNRWKKSSYEREAEDIPTSGEDWYDEDDEDDGGDGRLGRKESVGRGDSDRGGSSDENYGDDGDKGRDRKNRKDGKKKRKEKEKRKAEEKEEKSNKKKGKKEKKKEDKVKNKEKKKDKKVKIKEKKAIKKGEKEKKKKKKTEKDAKKKADKEKKERAKKAVKAKKKAEQNLKKQAKKAAKAKKKREKRQKKAKKKK